MATRKYALVLVTLIIATGTASAIAQPAAPAAQPAAQPAPAPAVSGAASGAKEAAAPQPAPPPGQPAAQPAPAGPEFYANYPEGPQSVRFLERAKQADASAKPPVIPPQPPRRRGSAGAAIAIALVYERAWTDDRGYNLVGDQDRVRQFGLWFSHDLWSLHPRIILAGEIGGAGWSDKSDYMDGELQASLATTTLHLGANFRYVPAPWLQPHLRVAGGMSFMNLEFDSTENNRREKFQDWYISPLGSLGIGFTLRTPTRLFETSSGDFASLSMGVMLECGYNFAKTASFSLKPQNSGKQRIEILPADLGKLDRSGLYLRTSLVVRF